MSPLLACIAIAALAALGYLGCRLLKSYARALARMEDTRRDY